MLRMSNIMFLSFSSTSSYMRVCMYVFISPPQKMFKIQVKIIGVLETSH